MLSNTTFSTFMTALDANIVIIALPAIGRELPGVSALDLIWVLIGYQLMISTLLVNFGRLGDIFGRVKLYRVGFVIFTLGSALSAIAQTGPELVAARFLQGGGGAMLLSNATAIIIDAFPVRERGRALGTNQVAVAAGSVFALVFGGILTGIFGWRSIFWINVPVGVLAVIWTQLHLKESGEVNRNQKIDVLGNATFLIGLTMVLASFTLYALQLLSNEDFILLAAASLVALCIFVVIELNVKHPMLDLSLFRHAPFAVGSMSAFLNNLARGTVLIVLTFYLQGPTMNLNPLAAGLYLVPNAVAIVMFGPLSGWLSDKYGPQLFTMLGMVSSMVGFILLAQVGPTASFNQLALPLILSGGGLGLFSSPNRASVMSSVPPETRGVASGVYLTFQNSGQTLSRAVAFLVMGLILSAADVQALFNGATGVQGPDWVNRFLGSVHLVFYISAVVLLIGIALSFLRFSRTFRQSEEY